jgi:hypothetical protein
MSGWKARIGYLSPSVFETPSDWDLILPWRVLPWYRQG